jgi:hypothetical protein
MKSSTCRRTSGEEIGPPAITDTKTFGSYLPQSQDRVEPGTTMKILGLRTDRSSGTVKKELLLRTSEGGDRA